MIKILMMNIDHLMYRIIQRVATGPELSKSIDEKEAQAAMSAILDNQVDPVQAAIFLIALRMKRESEEEYRGVLSAIRQYVDHIVAEVDDVLDLADPYDGYSRSLPVSPFLPALLAECGLHVISHGLDKVGPKYGITHRHVLKAAGVPVDLKPAEAAKRLSDSSLGWSYVDQAHYCPALHDLIPLRKRMVKRQVITTVEVLSRPISGRCKTHFMTGYVHTPYPPIYAMLARHVGFDSAILVRGVEGGIIPSLRQAGKYYFYHQSAELKSVDIHPEKIGVQSEWRALPLPDDLPQIPHPLDEVATLVETEAAAQAAAQAGLAALSGEKGTAYNALLYSGALVLVHLGHAPDLGAAAEILRSVLDSGQAARRIR